VNDVAQCFSELRELRVLWCWFHEKMIPHIAIPSDICTLPADRPEGRISMIDEPALTEILEILSESHRILNEAQLTLINELAALRETMKELGGERFASVFEKRQLAMMGQNLKVEELSRVLARIQTLKARTVVIPE
jgi:hypothetical protein